MCLLVPGHCSASGPDRHRSQPCQRPGQLSVSLSSASWGDVSPASSWAGQGTALGFSREREGFLVGMGLLSGKCCRSEEKGNLWVCGGGHSEGHVAPHLTGLEWRGWNAAFTHSRRSSQGFSAGQHHLPVCPCYLPVCLHPLERTPSRYLGR